MMWINDVQSAQDRYVAANSIPHSSIFNTCRLAANMLSRAAATADHLPALQAGFLTRLLDIRTAQSYTPRAIVPQYVDFQAFADSIDSDPSRSHWPPTAVNSPNARKRTLEDGVFDFSAVPNGNIPGPDVPGSQDETIAHLQSGARSGEQFSGSFDASSFDGLANLGVPDIPTASFALSLGSFLPDSSMDDMLFTSDAFW
jgi:hypothetical protein